MIKRLFKHKIIVHLALWGGFLGFLVLIFFLQHGKVHSSLFERISWGLLLFYINYLILIPQLLFKEKRAYYFFLSFVFLFTLTFAPVAVSLIRENAFSYERLFRGRFYFLLFMQLFFFVGAIALRFYEKWQENEKRAQKIRAEQFASELHYLKNQINPHFLFNSLNSIYALTVKQSEQAPEAVITLSELMRYMLYDTDQHLVSIEKEINYIENYLKLQRLRIADSSKVTMEVKGNITHQEISPLLFISFIENAFKYGADSSGQTVINIVLEVFDNEILFHCENIIGDEKKEGNTSEGIGLKNTKERLELLYPERHHLVIKHTDTTYTVDLKLEI